MCDNKLNCLLHEILKSVFCLANIYLFTMNFHDDTKSLVSKLLVALIVIVKIRPFYMTCYY